MCPANKTLSRSYLHLRVYPCCPLSRCSFFFPSSFESSSLMTVSFYNAIFSDKLFWLDLIKKSRVTTKKRFIYPYRALYALRFLLNTESTYQRGPNIFDKNVFYDGWFKNDGNTWSLKLEKYTSIELQKFMANLLQVVCSTDIIFFLHNLAVMLCDIFQGIRIHTKSNDMRETWTRNTGNSTSKRVRWKLERQSN